MKFLDMVTLLVLWYWCYVIANILLLDRPNLDSVINPSVPFAFQKLVLKLMLLWIITTLTLTVHSPTKSNNGKWRKCAKSDYVIEAGLIWEQNRCPGSDTQVACHGWTVHCGVGGPRFETQGEPPFFGPSLSEEIV